ncbi:cell wall-binding repeat-containing protein [Peptostreptococcus sp.]|uniref:cell wall-binding repeat-containing protein n=2 Tax=Peptostreptococcus sp. TaxID=1262 RepID=UPI0025D74C4F|nr:cell wall-binding repeat-containing protein [Peptostreptococcus sp.]
MNKFIKKSVCLTTASLMVIGLLASSGSVFATEYTKENSLTSLIQTDSNGLITYANPSKVVRDTYWADLEEGTIEERIEGLGVPSPATSPLATGSSFGSASGYIYKDVKYYGVFPKYVLRTSESGLKDLNVLNRGFGSDAYLPSTGITDSPLGMQIILKDGFYQFGYLAGPDYLNSEYIGKTSNDPVLDKFNPYGFREADLLSQDEIKDPTKLTVYGDIREKGSTDSNKIGEYRVGDQIKLDFSMDASWFKRYIMGYALSLTRGRYSYTVDRVYKGTLGKFDSQLVYTIDIPEGVDLINPSASISGLNDFNVNTDIKNDSGSKKLVISLKLNDDKANKEELWKDIIERIKKLDTSNIKISISGLYVNSKAQADTNIRLRGTIGGYFEWANTILTGVPSPAGEPTATGGYTSDTNAEYYRHLSQQKVFERRYLYFVTKQSQFGRDNGAPVDKPNLISYTFKVKKEPNNPTPGRIDGKDRIETAIKISKNNYDKAKTVIVVRHDLFPDSMTASVLAKLKDAPILLNPTAKLDSRVGDEIKRLGAQEVIIVGGQDSVSERVREDLKAYDADKNVERIAGTDRYGTSEMVAKRVVGITGKKNTGVVASGQVFPDALSVGTFASRDGYPILLVKKDSVPSQIQNAIKDLDINKTYIAGGLNTISKSTEAKLPNVVERMAGSTRYETSVAIAKSKFGASKEAYIASGEEFADALVISPISGKFNRPTLLVSRNKKVNSPVKAYIRNAGFTSITAIGGERFVPYSVLEDLVK